jgi:hypothetical protein
MSDRERLFWIGLRKALIELIRAIEVRYGLESAVITREQRKELRRLTGRECGRGEEGVN